MIDARALALRIESIRLLAEVGGFISVFILRDAQLSSSLYNLLAAIQ